MNMEEYEYITIHLFVLTIGGHLSCLQILALTYHVTINSLYIFSDVIWCMKINSLVIGNVYVQL